MNMPFINKLHLRSFLSFGPESEPIKLTPLNVLIGPNASGKSNFIEAFELLRAAPSDLADPIRFGGPVGEWLWKGEEPKRRLLGGSAGERYGSTSLNPATIHATLSKTKNLPDLQYRLAFTAAQFRLELAEELLAPSRPTADELPYFYHFQYGRSALMRQSVTPEKPGQPRFRPRRLDLDSLKQDQSILYQRRDPDAYPEIAWVANEFGRIKTFREWTFGRTMPSRQAQPADLPVDELHPGLTNLALVLNELQHTPAWPRFTRELKRFLPRFSHLSFKVQGAAIQMMLQEEDFAPPIPSTRLSDGTLRFMALLALLLRPEAASLICIEEPELGMHPDALAIIAELLVDASRATQLIVTTHSDILVSALTESAESVLVCENLRGGTQMRRVDTSKLKEWLKEYRLGEIWRLGKVGGNLW